MEERAALAVFRDSSKFILVPIRYRDEDRFAVGVVTKIKGEQVIQLIAVIMNHSQDEGRICSPDGTPAWSPGWDSASSNLN